jgi:hypothetical protein
VLPESSWLDVIEDVQAVVAETARPSSTNPIDHPQRF